MLTATTLVCAAVAAALMLAPAPDALRRRRVRVPSGAGARILLASGIAVLVVVARMDGLRLGLALIGVATAAGVVSLVASGRRQRLADTRRGRVVESCEALVGELRAGPPPVVALARCVEVWPDLAPVLACARMGGDVPAALHEQAALPGAEGLHEVAAAWQVSERSGAALTQALAQVAQSARAQQATRHLVRSELASAQATARTVAALPVVALGMASGVGADPWAFLFGSVGGLCCLGGGIALALLGLHWIDRIATKAMGP